MNKIAQVLNEALDLVARPGTQHPDSGPRFAPLDPPPQRYFEPRPRQRPRPSDPLRAALAGEATIPGGSNFLKCRAKFGDTAGIHAEIGRRLDAKLVANARRELGPLAERFGLWHARLDVACARNPRAEYAAFMRDVASAATPDGDGCPRDLAWFHARREQEIATSKAALAAITREAESIMKPVLRAAADAAGQLLDEEIGHDQARATKFGIPPGGLTEPTELHKSIQLALDGFTVAAAAPPPPVESTAWQPPSRWTLGLFEL